MKKIFIILFLLSSLLTSCLDTLNSSERLNNEELPWEENNDLDTLNSSETLNNEELPWEENNDIEVHTDYERMLNFEEVASMSDNIIVGEAVSKVAKDYYLFQFDIKTIIKGEVKEERIHIYTDKPHFKKNKEYVLFLEKFKSPYYDHIVYNLPFESFYMIDGDELVSFNSANQSCKSSYSSYKELVNYLNTIPDTSDYSPNEAVIHTDSTDLNEIFEISEFIIELKTVEEIIVAENVIFMKCKVIYEHKGDIEDELNIFLPTTAEVNENYLVTLNRTDGSYMITSKESFINVNDSAYKEAIDLLNKE